MPVLAVLIDTDVLLDFLIDREPFTKNAKDIIQRSQEKTISAFLAAHSITNIFYVLRRIYPVSERKRRLMDLCRTISVVEIGYELVFKVLSNKDFEDIEDCLQAECAEAVNANYIVTRNIKDYAHSRVPPILPEDLIKLLHRTVKRKQ